MFGWVRRLRRLEAEVAALRVEVDRLRGDRPLLDAARDQLAALTALATREGERTDALAEGLAAARDRLDTTQDALEEVAGRFDADALATLQEEQAVLQVALRRLEQRILLAGEQADTTAAALMERIEMLRRAAAAGPDAGA